MSKTSVIPEFSNDVDSMAVAVRSLKLAVENMTGQRADQGRAPRVFLQVRAPDVRAGTELEEGDLWINAATYKLRFWDGRVWQAVLL